MCYADYLSISCISKPKKCETINLFPYSQVFSQFMVFTASARSFIVWITSLYF